MKISALFLFIVLLLSEVLVAQNTQLEVRLSKIANSNNWEFLVDISLTENPGSGFVVNLPDHIKAVPVAIKLNGTDLWLKNSAEPPSSATVVHWEVVDSSLVLKCSADLLKAQDRLELNLMTQLSKRVPQNPALTLRKLNEADVLNGDVIATQNLNITR